MNQSDNITALHQGNNTSQPLQATAILQTAAPATAVRSSSPEENRQELIYIQ